MALKHVMINDIIAEHSARMQNLKKYYPFFVLNETTFTQYKDCLLYTSPSPRD